ncbi:class I SAM-dependent methyltransferase [Aureliella helgolandensis]|uniref:Uncharacterized protein n=1 Tax=Aureliella helgolandensis TaxID=2527968 RepID=A0A518G3H9_9BACT|nr:class I SAM-dependent methyltransferase [Aureliella helgolandensis]QDV23153.1 hypothetical protein Q31a_14490 [Aureliella helgolandensis]
MSRASWLQKIYWNYLGKPVQERALFKVLLENSISSILEIGVGDGSRMKRIAQLVQLSPGCEQLRYIGTDEFESASDGLHLSLKQAHQLASQLGFKASLIPGDAPAALPRVAHKLGAADLVLVNGGIDLLHPCSGGVGIWLNRVAHDETIILACQEIGEELVHVDSRNMELPSRIAA